VGCKRAREFLDDAGSEVQSVEDASKTRRGREAALELARRADTVIIARGKKVVRFDMHRDPPDEDTLAANLLGPTGNLRAPTFQRGKTLVVGFSADAYRDILK
jgi:arsenate reductase-like glutaredoxin family protein